MTVPQFYPSLNVITAITNSYPAVITLVVPIYYAVNEVISVRCPAAYGMQQINGKTAKILSVNKPANEITIDLDTSGFDPFIFVPAAQFAFSVPAGEMGTLDAAVVDNTLRAGYTPVGT